MNGVPTMTAGELADWEDLMANAVPREDSYRERFRRRVQQSQQQAAARRARLVQEIAILDQIIEATQAYLDTGAPHRAR